MLRLGRLNLDNNREYSVYFLDTNTTKRVDIVEVGAKFNDIEKPPVYGEYIKRGKAMNYGNKPLGQRLNTLMCSYLRKNLTTDTSVDYQDSIFVTKEVRQSEDVHYEKILHNSAYYSEVIETTDAAIAIALVDLNFNVDMPPMFLTLYESTSLADGIEEFVDLPYRTLSTLKKTYDLSWMKDKDYKIVTDLDEAKEYLNLLEREKVDIIGYDYETTTLDFIRGNTEAKIVGLVLSHKRNFSRYFPFEHYKIKNLPISFMDDVVNTIKNNNIKTVAHNAKYENTVNIHCGYDLRMTYCTYVLSCLLNSDRTKGIHSLKHLSFQETGERKLELPEIFLNKNKIDFRVLPEELVRYYACSDADDTLMLYHVLSKRLTDAEYGLFEMESELCYLTAVKEWWGFRINRDHFIKEYDNVISITEYLEKLIHGLTKSNVKLSSSKQMGELLYKRLNRPIYSYTNKGLPSVGVKAIQKLAKEKRDEPLDIVKHDIFDNNKNLICKASELNSAKYPECILLLKHKVYYKLSTAFFKRFYETAHGDRYFTWIAQMGTSSGRESSPMHQLPSAVKYDILPDSEEHCFVDQDYSCMEIRAMAWLAGEQELIDILADKTLDVHRGIAKIVTGIEPWALSKPQRNLQKRVNFGIPYLIGPYSLAEQLFGAAPTKEQVQQAKEAQQAFMNTFKRVANFLHNNREEVLRRGYMTTYFGRKRKFPRVFETGISRADREKQVRMANNLPVQGSCADIMKHAQIMVGRWIQSKHWDELVETPQGKFPKVRLVLTIHDELLLSVHKSVPLVEVYEMLRECMQVEIEGAPPFYATPAVTKNFGDCKNDKYEIPIELRDQMIEEYHTKGMWHEPWDNPVDFQLSLSDKFREDAIINWMEDLIKQHNSTDPKVISQYAHHNTLTHDLIARFPQSKEHKKQFGALDHMASIDYAVEQYMNYRKGIELPDVNVETTDGEEIDHSNTLTIEEVEALSETIVNTDDEGNEIETDNEEEDMESEEKTPITVFDAEYIESTTKYKQPVIWTLFNMVVIDINGMTTEQVDKVLAILDTQHKDNAYVKIQLYKNGKLIDTERRCTNFEEAPVVEYLTSIGKEC